MAPWASRLYIWPLAALLCLGVSGLTLGEAQLHPYLQALDAACHDGNEICQQLDVAKAIDYSITSWDKSDYSIGPYIQIRRISKSEKPSTTKSTDFIGFVNQRISRFLQNHKLLVDVPGVVRATNKWFKSDPEQSAVGRSGGFLAGFGLGFLAFGLKKLLLPVIIGFQIVKSVLIAMFLPSILGGLGKLVGKGVSTFASASGSSGGLSGGGGGGLDDFEFKDQGYEGSQDSGAAASPAENKYSFAYPDIYQQKQPIGTLPASMLYTSANSLTNAAVAPSYQSYTASIPATSSGGTSSKVAYVSNDLNHQGSYYTRHRPHKTAAKNKEAYKVFHNIPESSLLLTDYDPFYSPLLSRLDAVFKQLSYDSEDCRERLVCSMYRNPAQFAPYSNLVSAQLSRELNELRKPSTDNPEILRFFRYMRAAKDGQDGADCFALHSQCPAAKSIGTETGNSATSPTSDPPPMVKTYQDINKLVQARRI